MAEIFAAARDMLESATVVATDRAGSDRCPLCGQPNDCKSAPDGRACWCADATIRASALAAVPAQMRGKSCLCKACASGRARIGLPPGT